MTNRLPFKMDIQFELHGKIYRKFRCPIKGTRSFREITIDQRVAINPERISASTFYNRLKEARKLNIEITTFN